MAFGVQDILKILEQVPLWKALRALPERMDTLEKQIKVLEEELRRRPEPEHCSVCGSPMQLRAVEPHWMGDVEFHHMECPTEGCDYRRSKKVKVND